MPGFKTPFVTSARRPKVSAMPASYGRGSNLDPALGPLSGVQTTDSCAFQSCREGQTRYSADSRPHRSQVPAPEAGRPSPINPASRPLHQVCLGQHQDGWCPTLSEHCVQPSSHMSHTPFELDTTSPRQDSSPHFCTPRVATALAHRTVIAEPQVQRVMTTFELPAYARSACVCLGPNQTPAECTGSACLSILTHPSHEPFGQQTWPSLQSDIQGR
ncbi:unnamed protein product [Protopolystoma xenopodis]|uniref:Uncharacterized protein n=1 Tax=Protopolystoma xenopodis TaxID=117903 RepID=A0A448X7W7_9PLAT|nr:unnamed protein product [Protopolystoma xenopodis]